jgi:hypothetical protein
LAIAPCNSIHTFFMRFTIDVLFVRRDGEVARVALAVRPWRIALSPRAHAVVEMAAGSIGPTGTRVGDVLALVPATTIDVSGQV